MVGNPDRRRSHGKAQIQSAGCYRPARLSVYPYSAQGACRYVWRDTRRGSTLPWRPTWEAGNLLKGLHMAPKH
jgi:hypothetical protein